MILGPLAVVSVLWSKFFFLSSNPNCNNISVSTVGTLLSEFSIIIFLPKDWLNLTQAKLALPSSGLFGEAHSRISCVYLALGLSHSCYGPTGQNTRTGMYHAILQMPFRSEIWPNWVWVKGRSSMWNTQPTALEALRRVTLNENRWLVCKWCS